MIDLGFIVGLVQSAVFARFVDALNAIIDAILGGVFP